MNTPDKLMEIYELLLGRFGPQHWWPGESPFEVIAGAVLTQNTNWTNVEKAIANLKLAGVLSPGAIHKMAPASLAELIRPAGYYRLKSKRLKNLIDRIFDEYGGDLTAMETVETGLLRQALLSVAGIGPETADSILLYAFGRPVFVIDAYTARVACRHGLAEPEADYAQLQDLFQSNLPPDVKMFNEYHALLVRLGKEHCRRLPRCVGCPLERLPHNINGD